MELFELYQSHLARIIDLMEVTSEILRQCYAYDPEDPELWQCCNLVCDIAKRAQSTLTLESAATPQTALLKEEWLRPAVQVIRVTLHILRGVKPNYQPEVLLALRDLDRGLLSAVEVLDRVAQSLPHRESAVLTQ